MSMHEAIDQVIEASKEAKLAQLHYLDMLMLLGDDKSAEPERQAYMDANDLCTGLISSVAAQYGISFRVMQRAFIAGRMLAELENSRVEGMLF